MDFAQILDEWEKGRSKRDPNQREAAAGENGRQAFEQWLDKAENWKYYDKGSPESESDPAAKRQYLRNLEPEDEIDLHGFTVEESLVRLDRFLNEAVHRGLRKVLIVHGKGNHSHGAAVLPKAVLEYLQNSPLAGELGQPRREKGGSGATWVIIKNPD